MADRISGRYATPETREKAVEAVRGGRKIKEVAKEIGFSPTVVSRWCRAVGIQRRETVSAYPIELRTKVAKEYLQTQSTRESLAKKYKLSPATISRFVAEHRAHLKAEDFPEPRPPPKHNAAPQKNGAAKSDAVELARLEVKKLQLEVFKKLMEP